LKRIGQVYPINVTFLAGYIDHIWYVHL